METHGKTRHAPEELACCASDCRSSSADLTMSADPSWEMAIVRAMMVKRREFGRRSGQLSCEDGAETKRGRSWRRRSAGRGVANEPRGRGLLECAGAARFREWACT